MAIIEFKQWILKLSERTQLPYIGIDRLLKKSDTQVINVDKDDSADDIL